MSEEIRNDELLEDIEEINEDVDVETTPEENELPDGLGWFVAGAAAVGAVGAIVVKKGVDKAKSWWRFRKWKKESGYQEDENQK